jgi:hypothetical protein
MEDHTKPTMLSFMEPIIDMAMAPIRNEIAEKHSIQERIFDTTKLKTPKWSERFIKEYIEFLIPTPHVLEPVTMDIVYERQDSPAQRAILNRAQVMNLPDRERTQTFLKAEAVLKPGPARLVSTAHEYVKLHYSTFMYSLADHLKT